jgi:hypothetical protein
MPKLKTTYATAEEIPPGFEELYSDKNGKFELTGVEGVKTQGDVDRLDTALKNERAEHKAAKDALTKFNTLGKDFDPDSVAVMKESLDEANARLAAITADNKIDESKLNERQQAAIAAALGPVQRDLKAQERLLEAERKKSQTATQEAEQLRGTIKETQLRGAIRDGLATAVNKVIPLAVDDAVLVGMGMFELKDDGSVVTRTDLGDRVTPGLTPKEWVKEMEEKRPYWFEASVGGGSRGGDRGLLPSGKGNPWSAESWNLTEQGKYLREHKAEKAAAMAARAGSSLGATKPPVKA